MPLTTLTKPFVIAAVSAACLISAASASPMTHNDVAFSYKASELQANTVQNLYRRIESRAESVCGARNARALYEKELSAKCVNGLVKDWVSKIGDARLTNIHAQAEGERNYASLK